MNYIEEYKKIFEGGKFLRDGEEITFQNYRAFDGGGVRVLYDKIIQELENRKSVTILDYGCGEALQWHSQALRKKTISFPNLIGEKLQGFYRYDPAYEIYNKKPTTKFDFVLCGDVLEHVPDEELDNFFVDINSYVEDKGIVFYSISTNLSRNSFLDGSNMHINIKSPSEWFDILKKKSNHKTCVVFNGKHNY